MAKVINLYGGPGIGKSVFAARLYAELAMHTKCVELASEYAKELVWKKEFELLKDQMHVSSRQIDKIHYPLMECEIVVTDSPIRLGLVYCGISQYGDVKEMIETWELQNPHESINILLNRDRKDYRENGRLQSLSEAEQKDEEIIRMLNDNGLEYFIFSNTIHPSEVIRELQL